MERHDFAGRTILITGAGSGIGRATAATLAGRAAARLILVDRDAAGLDRTAIELDRPGLIIDRHVGDVGDEGLWESIAPTPINHAVGCAGIAGSGMIADLAFAEWRRVLHVNLDGLFLTLRWALRSMVDNGSIVLVASAAGLKVEPGMAPYAASKAAAIQLAKVAAKEGAPRRIRANAIAPGGVETPIWNGLGFFEDLAEKLGSRDKAFAAMAEMGTLLGRYATPEEIAGQIAYLLSDACGYVTGSTFVADGGYTL